MLHIVKIIQRILNQIKQIMLVLSMYSNLTYRINVLRNKACNSYLYCQSAYKTELRMFLCKSSGMWGY